MIDSTDSRFLIRLADADDDDFIIGLVSRFVDFQLPSWRRRNECIEGIRRDLHHHLQDQPANSFMFVAEDSDAQRAGFMHLQKVTDFFNGRVNCHISDLAVDRSFESRGAGHALLAHAEEWAAEHRCHLMSLAVFPGNERARSLYEKHGYDVDLVRMSKPLR